MLDGRVDNVPEGMRSRERTRGVSLARARRRNGVRLRHRRHGAPEGVLIGHPAQCRRTVKSVIVAVILNLPAAGARPLLWCQLLATPGTINMC